MLLGDIEIEPIVDAVGELGELAELYPDTPASHWDPYRDLYPELFTETRWRLPFTSYLLRTSGTTVLVDTGIGPPGAWDIELETEGELPNRLEELGVARDAIDVVFLTHLHIDHVGWNADESGVVFFPRARYVVHADALSFVRANDGRPHVSRCVYAIADRFETVEGETALATGIRAVPLPGHYPGHMGLRLSAGGEDAVLIADAAVHPALLDRPELRYVSDLDYERCLETRRRLIDEIVDADVLAVCGHYPEGGIGRVVTRDGSVVWEAQ